jgi:hypothetical protein
MLITTALALVVRVTTAILDFVIEIICLYCGHVIPFESDFYPADGGPVHVNCAYHGGYYTEDLYDPADDLYDTIMDR